MCVRAADGLSAGDIDTIVDNQLFARTLVAMGFATTQPSTSEPQFRILP